MANENSPKSEDWADPQPVVSGSGEDLEQLLDDQAKSLGVKRPKKG